MEKIAAETISKKLDSFSWESYDFSCISSIPNGAKPSSFPARLTDARPKVGCFNRLIERESREGLRMKNLSGNATEFRSSSGFPEQYPPFLPKRNHFLKNHLLPLRNLLQVGHEMSQSGSEPDHPASKGDLFSCSLVTASKNNGIGEVKTP